MSRTSALHLVVALLVVQAAQGHGSPAPQVEPTHLRLRAARIVELFDQSGTGASPTGSRWSQLTTGPRVAFSVESDAAPSCGPDGNPAYLFLIDSDRSPTTGGVTRAVPELGIDSKVEIRCDPATRRFVSQVGAVEVRAAAGDSPAIIEVIAPAKVLPSERFHWVALAHDGKRFVRLPEAGRFEGSAAKAFGSAERQHGSEHRFVELDGGDLATLVKVPSVFDPLLRETSTSTADPDSGRVPLAFSQIPLKPYKYDPDLAKRLLDEAGWTVGADGIRAKGGRKLKLNWLTSPNERLRAVDVIRANLAKVNSASTTDRNQNAGGTVLQWVENSVVMAGASPAPSLPWTSSGPVLMTSIRRAPIEVQTESAPPLMKAIFVATGRSSGPAFQMTMVYDGAEPAELVDPGFVLEPVQNVTAQEAEAELSRIKGRRVKATIDAYCLQMQKPAPGAGMVYRLARSQVQEQNDHLGLIMMASKLLQTRGQLHPDGDPAEYFHSIRQWALWTEEQGFKDEAAFTRAFIEHSKKNVTAAGRRWTPELEQAVRRLMPNRWRDITEVMKLAGSPRVP